MRTVHAKMCEEGQSSSAGQVPASYQHPFRACMITRRPLPPPFFPSARNPGAELRRETECMHTYIYSTYMYKDGWNDIKAVRRWVGWIKKRRQEQTRWLGKLATALSPMSSVPPPVGRTTSLSSSPRARNWSEGNVIRQWRLHVQRESLAFLGTYIIHVVVGSCPLHTVEHANRPLLLCIVRGMDGDPHPIGTAAS